MQEDFQKERDEDQAKLQAQDDLVKSLQQMVVNLYSMQGKPVPEMPPTPEWNIVSFVRTISITIFGITICIHLIGSIHHSSIHHKGRTMFR